MNENVTKGILLSLSTLAVGYLFFADRTDKGRVNPTKKPKTWIQMFDASTREVVEPRAFTTLEFIENNSEDDEVDENVLKALTELKRAPDSVVAVGSWVGTGFFIREAILNIAKLSDKREVSETSTSMRVSKFYEKYGDLEKEIKELLKGAEDTVRVKKDNGDVIFVSLKQTL